MDYLEKIEEEKLVIKWSLIGGLAIAGISAIMEFIMSILGGFIGVRGLLDLPTIVLLGGLITIFSGLYRMIKQFFKRPPENKIVEENFKNKLILGGGGIFVILSLLLFALKMIAPGLVLFDLALSIPRLFILIGGGIFFYGLYNWGKRFFKETEKNCNKLGDKAKSSWKNLFSRNKNKEIETSNVKALPLSDLRVDKGTFDNKYENVNNINYKDRYTS